MTTIEIPVGTVEQGSGGRRLSVGDLAIIVGAAAVFFGGLRWSLVQPVNSGWTFHSPNSAFNLNQQVLAWPIQTAGFLLVVLSWMMVGLRLRSPRPNRLILMRQPGWVACFSAALASLIPIALDWSTAWILHRNARVTWSSIDLAPLHLVLVPQQTVLVAGVVVVVSWLNLGLGSQWRGEPHWIDRLGRLVGVAWLILLVVYAASLVVSPLL